MPQFCKICLNFVSEKNTLASACECLPKYCRGCIKELLIRGTRYEDEMPAKCPTCWKQIPRDTARKILTASEVSMHEAHPLYSRSPSRQDANRGCMQMFAFENKLDEWATCDRLYCPIPACSTFIAPRFYLRAVPPAPRSMDRHLASWTSKDSVYDPENHLPTVCCPGCFLSVCTNCRQESHRMDLDQNQRCTRSHEPTVDPLTLAGQKALDTRTCPRCRRVVRLETGTCKTIFCKCGIGFCYGCSKAVDDCEFATEDCRGGPVRRDGDSDDSASEWSE